MRRLALGIAFVGFAGTALTAALVGCGDDDVIGATPDGGASSSGATSSSGAASSSGTASSSGATSSSGGSSGSTSGGTDGGSDGGVDAAAPNTNKVTCGTTECDSTTQVCCAAPDVDGGSPDAGTLGYKCQAAGDQCTGAKVTCDEKADCPGGTNVCCTNVSGTAIASECKMTCGGSEVQLCKTAAECGDGGACTQYSCPLGRKLYACEKPVGCN
jgi:hypothetical protein